MIGCSIFDYNLIDLYLVGAVTRCNAQTGTPRVIRCAREFGYWVFVFHAMSGPRCARLACAVCVHTRQTMTNDYINIHPHGDATEYACARHVRAIDREARERSAGERPERRAAAGRQPGRSREREPRPRDARNPESDAREIWRQRGAPAAARVPPRISAGRLERCRPRHRLPRRLERRVVEGRQRRRSVVDGRVLRGDIDR